MENTDYLLTIAIPTYNRKNLLKRALDSVIPQLNPKVEVLVSDNASDDGTEEMIAGSYSMVRYVKNETNLGWDRNFLQCYRKAKGKYVVLLGSDDRIANGGVDHLTSFLEKNDCDLVFLNYRGFDTTKEDIYIKNGEWIKGYEAKQDIVTKDKDLFMEYVDHGITFISACVAKRSLVSAVEEPERFIGTNFIHTYLMLEAIKGKQTLFGVIMQPIIEQNLTAGDAEVTKSPEMFYAAYGRCMYHALCIHAVECGFQKKEMRKVYLHRLHDYPFWRCVLSDRRNNSIAMDVFWRDCYPVVKKFPSEWVKVMCVVLTPRCVINMLYKIHKTLKRANELS